MDATVGTVRELEAAAQATTDKDELRALVIEMRIYIMRHGVAMGECVAWRKLKQRYGVGGSQEGWDADLEWLRAYRNDPWLGRGLPGETKRKSKVKDTTPARPTSVCLCGSTRFYDAFQQAEYEETMAGRIYLSVGFYANSPDQMVQQHGENVGITPDEKVRLDELHKRKIDMADEILVLNVGGYVGESTRSEIDYAVAHGKRVRWLEEPEQKGS